jgi:hypothetical protein
VRIYIKENKKRIFIPIPLSLLKAVISIIQMPLVLRNISEHERRYIDAINFKELKKSIDMLKEYKGLKIVEVKDSEGHQVSITI